MKRIIYYILTMLILSLFIIDAKAECSDEEFNSLKDEISKITISYKHLGEVTKEDGSTSYDEFLVTAKNILENVYVHLYPMTSEKFQNTDNGLIIKLTTGEWKYNMYSSKCERIVDTISLKLPKFNIYSLDPLCDGVDSEEFKLCGKYYEPDVSREDFERRVSEYRKNHINNVDEDKNEERKENVILQNIYNFIKQYYIYIIITVVSVLIISIIIYVVNKKKKKKILQ